MLLLDLAMSSPAYWTIAKPNRGNVRVSYYSGGQPGFGYHVGVNVVVVGSFAKRSLGVASKSIIMFPFLFLSQHQGPCQSHSLLFLALYFHLVLFL